MNEYECSRQELQILLCVAKCRQQLGRSMIIDVLRASHSVRVFSRRLYLLSAFGTLREHSAEEVDAMIQSLLDRGLLEESGQEPPNLMLTDRSKKILHAYAEESEDLA